MARSGHYPGKALWPERESGARLMIVLQSLGWEHYEVHEPEPHMLLFKYAAWGNTLLFECLLTQR